MKIFYLFIFFLGIAGYTFAQIPTINVFPVGSATVAPYSGSTGTTMTITGTNFTGATAVSFGGTAAASFNVVTATTITAVVGAGTTGSVSVTTPAGTATRGGFTYLPLSRLITNFGGYWSTTTAAANSTVPDDSHNLLGFGYNSVFYSTGVSDATLTTNSVSFTAGNYRALPVAGIGGTSPAGTNSVFLAIASKADGNATMGSVAGVASSTVRSVLLDGTRGLNLGTGVTNLPTSAIITFDIFSIDASKISDAEPDLLITQIADPSAGNDNFQFVDAGGSIVGNSIAQDMTVLTSFGTYKLDLFALTPSTLYNSATPTSVSSSNVTRSIRVVAFKLSDFGITAGNVANVKGLKITPSGNSDYAFIAYNANSINIPPNISQNDALTTSIVCTNGTAVLSVIGTAASGGTLSYSWERSVDGGTVWSAVTNGGNFSGATTTSLNIINPVNSDKYRSTVSETAASTTTNVSDPFTLTVSVLSVGGTVSGSATVCAGTNSTAFTLSGKTGSVIRWESSIDNFSTVTNIANTTTSLTATNLTATTQYRAVVQNGPCATANSSAATVTVNSSIGGSIAGGATVCSGVNSTLLTLSGHTGSVVKWQYSTNNFTTSTDVSNSTVNLTATNLSTTTQYRAVVQNGTCASANSLNSTITVVSSAGGTVAGSASVCAGVNSTVLTLSGYSGSIIRWQSSLDNFTTSADIVNATANLTATNLSATTKYRAVIQNGSCGSTSSSIATITILSNQWIGGASGDWNNAANWCGGVPTLTTNISIPASSVVYIQSEIGLSNSITIASGASVIMTGNYNLRIAAGGTFTNNGTFNASASTGALIFLGNGNITGTTTFKNIEANGSLNFGTSSTISGELILQPGASVITNSPTYLCPGSSLTYNTGGIYLRSLEWPAVSSGQGLPSNVNVQGNTSINFPAAGVGYICNDLTIDNGSGLYQNYSGASAALTVGRHVTINGSLSLGSLSGDGITAGGNWTRNSSGVFNNNGLSVTFNSSANSVITAPSSSSRNAYGAFGGETFYNINVDKAAASSVVSLASNISVINELKITSGKLDLANSDLVIVSDATSTAHVAVIPATGAEVQYGGAGGTGTGRFIIQRHLQIGTGSVSRRWRLLTAPLQPAGAPTINTAWQEGVSNADRTNPVNPWPGFGTTITKSTVYNAADGYDQGSTNNTSLYYYSPARVWSVLASTKAGAITDKEGYMLFARGNRSIVVSTPTIAASPTILEPKGRINIGNVQKTLAVGLQVIGNPYASAIDFGRITFNNYVAGGSTYNNVTAEAPGGVGITYYIFDPKTGGTSGVGKFISCSSNGDGTFAVTGNTSGLPTDGTIQSGIAFMISADNSGGTLTFHETDKLTTSSSVGVASNRLAYTDKIALFTSNLFSGLGEAASLADGVINAYHTNYQNEVNAQDAPKINIFNSKESLSIARENKSLSIERRNVNVVNDTIFLHMANMNKAAYTFQFIAKNFDPSLVAILEDKFTGVSKSIHTGDTTVIDFKITADSNSAVTDRFRVLLKSAGVLPLTITSIEATRQHTKIAVQWSVENEAGIKEYDIERSADGRTFSKVHGTVANNSNVVKEAYSWIDESAAEGDNIYRIKSTDLNGKSTYSKTVKVVFNNVKSTIAVYPNPVTKENIELQFSNVPQGNYRVKIVNALGKIVSKAVVRHTGGSALQTIVHSGKLTNGAYLVQLDGNQRIYTLKLILKKIQ